MTNTKTHGGRVKCSRRPDSFAAGKNDFRSFSIRSSSKYPNEVSHGLFLAYHESLPSCDSLHSHFLVICAHLDFQTSELAVSMRITYRQDTKCNAKQTHELGTVERRESSFVPGTNKRANSQCPSGSLPVERH